jgi:immune inhibitor A
MADFLRDIKGGNNMNGDRNQFCAMPPHPDLLERIQNYERAPSMAGTAEVVSSPLYVPWKSEKPLGQDDGITQPTEMLVGIEQAAPPARMPAGPRTLRVIVVLVGFAGAKMTGTAAHFQNLFFSTGRVIPTGSVREYYEEVSRGLVKLQGDISGPFYLPHPASYYANGSTGRGTALPNMQTMAADTLAAIGPRAYKAYDNDGDGFVDAFIIVHAGTGAEFTGSPNDLWSLKWTLRGAAYVGTDGTKVYGFLTVPEDAHIGVCAHELGHLLFKLPDLYDTSGRTSGIGRWCLMSGGAWNGTNGDTPAHLSAWCKAQLGWAPINAISAPTTVTFNDIETSGEVSRINVGGTEYFLIENRQKKLFDASLPGAGLLIFHVEDSRPDNTSPRPRIALVQADNRGELETAVNRGEAGDPYPGTAGNTRWDGASRPKVVTYAPGSSTISVKKIAFAGPTATADCSD